MRMLHCLARHLNFGRVWLPMITTSSSVLSSKRRQAISVELRGGHRALELQRGRLGRGGHPLRDGRRLLRLLAELALPLGAQAGVGRADGGARVRGGGGLRLLALESLGPLAPRRDAAPVAADGALHLLELGVLHLGLVGLDPHLLLRHDALVRLERFAHRLGLGLLHLGLVGHGPLVRLLHDARGEAEVRGAPRLVQHDGCLRGRAVLGLRNFVRRLPGVVAQLAVEARLEEHPAALRAPGFARVVQQRVARFVYDGRDLGRLLLAVRANLRRPVIVKVPHEELEGDVVSGLGHGLAEAAIDVLAGDGIALQEAERRRPAALVRGVVEQRLAADEDRPGLLGELAEVHLEQLQAHLVAFHAHRLDELGLAGDNPVRWRVASSRSAWRSMASEGGNR
mmetsp:Transcript_30427/g.97061  ORF Transcript_30427/g.97061 Transcript_30427/m.97061 type:complete len:397 (+) Transcript_30427:30-1220(+)